MYNIFDGDSFWMISNSMGKRRISGKGKRENKARNMASAMLPKMPDVHEKNGSKYKKSKKKYSYDYIGKEKCNGVMCNVLGLREDKGAKKEYIVKWWISDKKNDVMKNMVSSMEILSSNFKTIKGDRFAFYTEMGSKGKKMFSTSIKSIKINESMSDSLFDPNTIKIKSIARDKKGNAASRYDDSFNESMEKGAKKGMKKKVMKGLFGSFAP